MVLFGFMVVETYDQFIGWLFLNKCPESRAVNIAGQWKAAEISIKEVMLWSDYGVWDYQVYATLISHGITLNQLQLADIHQEMLTKACKGILCPTELARRINNNLNNLKNKSQ